MPVEAIETDPYLFAPVIAGMWKQHELWDGTYTLDDLLDAHECLDIKEENRSRANKEE